MAKELLPIGSVVQLTGSPALVMIAGYLPIEPNHPDYMWDYSGFRFPLGFDSTDDIYCFNDDQIQVVYAQGYRDIEQETFMTRLLQAREQIDSAVRDATAPAGEETEVADRPAEEPAPGDGTQTDEEGS